MTLHRYWFKFALDLKDPHPAGVLAGCGVTAYDYDDALQLLGARVFKELGLPRIVETVEDVDISTLDPGHVLPNMRPPTERGIWFPLGFE